MVGRHCQGQAETMEEKVLNIKEIRFPTTQKTQSDSVTKKNRLMVEE